MKNEDSNKILEDLLSSYAIDTILYSIASFWHALFILVAGWLCTEIVLNKIKTLITAASNGDVAINDGVRLLLFSVVCGSMNYIGGQLVSAKAEIIMSMLGFNTKSDSSSQTITKRTTAASGATTTDTQSTYTGKRPKDFLTIYELQQNWELFYVLQRGIMIVSPYLYIFAIELALSLVLLLTYLYR